MIYLTIPDNKTQYRAEAALANPHEDFPLISVQTKKDC